MKELMVVWWIGWQYDRMDGILQNGWKYSRMDSRMVELMVVVWDYGC